MVHGLWMFMVDICRYNYTWVGGLEKVLCVHSVGSESSSQLASPHIFCRGVGLNQQPDHWEGDVDNGRYNMR